MSRHQRRKDHPPSTSLRVLPLGYGIGGSGEDRLEPRRAQPQGALAAPVVARETQPAATLADLRVKALGEVEEVIAQRLGQVSRRLEEMHQAEEVRTSEHRKETWVLLFGLSIVLLFCFAAFFMNQIEVHDLHSGLQGDIERRSDETVESIQKAVTELYGKNMPRLQSAIEKAIKEKDLRDQDHLVKILSELEAQGAQRGAQLLDNQKLLESSLDRIERLAGEMRALQNARPAPAAEAPSAAAGASPASGSAVRPAAGPAAGPMADVPASAAAPQALPGAPVVELTAARGRLLPESLPAAVQPAPGSNPSSKP